MKTKINTRVISLLLIALMVLPIMMPLMGALAVESWSTVSAPTLESITANSDGTVSVSVNAPVGDGRADSLTVNMYEGGNIISTVTSDSKKSSDAHELIFSPVKSGSYEFEAVISRAGEENKVGQRKVYTYTLPLSVPYITIASNLGGGAVNVIWNPTREAKSYNVYVNDSLYQTTENRDITITGLTIGSEAKIEVEAVRGSEKSEKSSINITIGEEKRDWNFTTYGPSTNSGDNKFNEKDDGSVIISSLSGKGKIQPTGADGLSFYYTAIPADQNFVFRAKVSVNYWYISNGQEGFGIMAMDHVPSGTMYGQDFWSNVYMAASTKIEYRYEDVEEGEPNIYTVDSIYGDKYSMKLGIGTISKTGINQDILDRTKLGESGLIVGTNGNLQSVVETLEYKAGTLGKKPGTYNVIGNYKENTPEGTLEEEYLLTEMILEIEKNPTGYFITYYVEDKDGNLTPVRTIKNYDPNALEQFDKDYVYVGMFASRNAKVTFSDIVIETTPKAEDTRPVEPKPPIVVTPTVTVTSASSTTSTNYNLIADFNAEGTVQIYMNNKLLHTDTIEAINKEEVQANPKLRLIYERLNTVLDFSEVARYGEKTPNALKIVFSPDADQFTNLFPEDVDVKYELSTTYDVWFNMDITLYKGNYHKKTIYVAPYPTGMYYGNGTKEHPYDIQTAIKLVVPGQTIVLMEGTYKLDTGLRIERGINGTAENPIRMIADPEAKTRPIIDFVGLGTGITCGANWWYFYGFDVTNTIDGSKGFQVSGNYNVLDQINTYYNGNTGIQISRYHAADLTMDRWPANNLILNCTSYGNADVGFEDADGFAAKLTIGEGNVFDGCVAYNNADDGWDLYAKIATGEIGAVIIRNCVAYANGFLEDGKVAGNGNGFKMGGDSLPGQHQLINCIAFNNRAKGIDSNSCPDIIVKDCISYNNGSHNVAFYTNSANTTNFSANNVISIKDNKLKENTVKDKLEGIGNQDKEKYENASNYYWDGTVCKNKEGKELTTDIFVSTEFTGITRNADGTINMNGFLALNEKAPAGAGTTGDSTASAKITLLPDAECTFPEEWTITDQYVHWHECECGNKNNIEEHVFEYVIEKEPTEDTVGYKHNECTICGYKRPTIEIPSLGNPNANQPDAPANVGGIIGFFQMIWQAILNFFRTIFGLR